MTTTPDFTLADHGSLVILTPATPEARTYAEETLGLGLLPGWMGGYAIRTADADHVLATVEGEGFTVALA